MKAPTLWTICLAIFGPFMAAEFGAWFGWLHKTIRHAAISIIPSEYRERYEEEWQSNLEDVPGEVGKLLHSVGLLQASLVIRIASKPLGQRMMRASEIVIAASALLLLAPIFVVIALAIKINSPGPVLVKVHYRDGHERIGTEAEIKLLNFRLFEISHSEGLRVTRLGFLIGKYSLHQLPALLSIIRGDASLRELAQLFRR